MHFQIKRDTLLKSLNIAHNIIERKNTLPILSNVLLDIKGNKLSIVATDLDLVFYDEITDLKVTKEGSTTTSATVLHDLLRKLPSNLDIIFNLKDENKLNISAENSKFNLLCLPVDNFPNFSDNFEDKGLILNKKDFLSLLNKTKISMSNDETRHYLNGIYIHTTESKGKLFLTGVATDSHRLSSSSMPIENSSNFKPFILPKKTVFQLCSLLEDSDENITLNSTDTKIQFKIGNSKIISKIIDGKFPDYQKVVPKNNSKILTVNAKDFINSVERVITVSIDRKEGVKITLDKNNIQLFVNSSSSGEGKEILKANYGSEPLTVSFNSRYLLDIASEIENESITLNLQDAVSPVLILDNSDKQSYFVIMPMKI
jgi:DNA polymerase-3 subunit beta